MTCTFIIDTDHLPDTREGDTGKALTTAPDDRAGITRLREDATAGHQFRLYDDDGELYYTGRAIWSNGAGLGDQDSTDAFAPLDWAMNWAGCTRIDYLDPATDTWRTL